MIIGVPKEVKDNEYRVALTPEDARELTQLHLAARKGLTRLLIERKVSAIAHEPAPGRPAATPGAHMTSHSDPTFSNRAVAEAHGLDHVAAGSLLPGIEA